MKSLFLLFVLSFNFFLPKAVEREHAIYISVVEIKQETDLETGVIKVKIFTDDLEDAIQNKMDVRLKLTDNCGTHSDLLAEYLSAYLKIRINDQTLDYSFVDCEIVDMSIWLEFEFQQVEDWQYVEITGDHLMELFPTQTNVFTLDYKDQRRMFKLTNNDRTALLEL